MSGLKTRIKRAGGAVLRWSSLFYQPGRTLRNLRRLMAYMGQKRAYRRMQGAESLTFSDSYPCLGNATATTSFDPSYFYGGIWAFRHIHAQAPPSHVDVGSHSDFVGFLTVITDVTFVDIRPLEADLPRLTSLAGSLLEMPYADGSIDSLSCLHVVEHIGLGRYGDPLDPLGTVKACRELARILAPGGRLYITLPIGAPRVCFNAHRVHSPSQVLEYFSGLELLEFGATDDQGRLRHDPQPADFEEARYSCGFFLFTKKEAGS